MPLFLIVSPSTGKLVLFVLLRMSCSSFLLVLWNSTYFLQWIYLFVVADPSYLFFRTTKTENKKYGYGSDRIQTWLNVLVRVDGKSESGYKCWFKAWFLPSPAFILILLYHLYYHKTSNFYAIQLNNSIYQYFKFTVTETNYDWSFSNILNFIYSFFCFNS